MTIDYHITTFESEIIEDNGFSTRKIKVELDIHWVSSGYYVVSYPESEFKPFVDSPKMRKADGMSIAIDPQWLDKVIELYPSVEKPTDRTKTFIPFFQEFDCERGMFDMGQDDQFSAYKHQKDGWIVLQSHHACRGVPTRDVSSWTVKFDDLKALREKLKDPTTEQPMWSGCRIEGNPFA